ncbi:MAG: hypothetical protein K2M56_01450 [Muribaculaceae bacterium]|nr:hypothetical protein [Muribaculaceae bacterium]
MMQKDFCRVGKNGWANGRNIFAKLASASASALLTSAAYSLSAAVCYLTNTEIYLERPSLDHLMLVSANTITSQNLVIRTNILLSNNPDLDLEVGRDIVESAVAHNLILESLEANDEILPKGKLEEAYTSEQLAYLNSLSYSNFYNAIPGIIDGSISESSYTHVLGMSFENQVMDLYVTGLKGITANSATSFINNTKTLCREYVEVVKDANTLNEDSRKAVLSSLYIGPLSIMHWSEKVAGQE